MLAKKRAKENGLEFSISKDDIDIPTVCPILGVPIWIEKDYRSDHSISIDRDNKKGYTKDNIIIISWRANRIKSKASLEEMHRLVNKFWDTNQIQDSVNETLDNNKYKKELIKSAKKRANKKNIEFDLQTADIFIPKFCPILGIPIIKGDKVFTDYSPSIDRIDNTKGYIVSNVRVISRRANTLKNDASFEEYRIIFLYYQALASKNARKRAIFYHNLWKHWNITKDL